MEPMAKRVLRLHREEVRAEFWEAIWWWARRLAFVVIVALIGWFCMALLIHYTDMQSNPDFHWIIQTQPVRPMQDRI